MIFISTTTYALGKEVGFVEATAEFQRQLASPDEASLPCVRTIARLRRYDEVRVFHDAAATCLGKARARAFHEGLLAKPDVYLTVDDDVEADAYTLGMMLEAVNGQNNVVLAPCITRGSNVVNVAIQNPFEWRALPSGGRLLRVVAGGFGLVAMSGATMRALVEAHPDLHFLDEGQPRTRKTAIFFDLLEPLPGTGENSWIGEDVAFCRRAHLAGVRLEALATGLTSHDGQILKLESVAELPVLQAE